MLWKRLRKVLKLKDKKGPQCAMEEVEEGLKLKDKKRATMCYGRG